MQTYVVSTEEFQRLMSDQGFVRLNLNEGKLGDREYFVGVAPESLPAFEYLCAVLDASPVDLLGVD